jgi:hypothetical protein
MYVISESRFWILFLSSWSEQLWKVLTQPEPEMCCSGLHCISDPWWNKDFDSASTFGFNLCSNSRWTFTFRTKAVISFQTSNLSRIQSNLPPQIQNILCTVPLYLKHITRAFVSDCHLREYCMVLQSYINTWKLNFRYFYIIFQFILSTELYWFCSVYNWHNIIFPSFE